MDSRCSTPASASPPSTALCGPAYSTWPAPASARVPNRTPTRCPDRSAPRRRAAPTGGSPPPHGGRSPIYPRADVARTRSAQGDAEIRAPSRRSLCAQSTCTAHAPAIAWIVSARSAPPRHLCRQCALRVRHCPLPRALDSVQKVLIRTKVSLAGGLQVECRHFAGRGCLAHAAGGLRRWVTMGIGRSMEMAVWDAWLRRVRGALAAGGIGDLRRNHRTDCNP